MTYKVVRLLRNKKTGQIFEQKYFKNTLFMNVRHSNYDLYLEFKKIMGNKYNF